MGFYAFHFMHAFSLHRVSITLIYDLMTSLIGLEEAAEVMLLCDVTFRADDQCCTPSSVPAAPMTVMPSSLLDCSVLH